VKSLRSFTLSYLVNAGAREHTAAVRGDVCRIDDFAFTRVKFRLPHMVTCKFFDPYLPIHHTTFMAL